MSKTQFYIKYKNLYLDGATKQKYYQSKIRKWYWNSSKC